MRLRISKIVVWVAVALFFSFLSSAMAINWSGNEGFDKGKLPANQIAVDTTNFYRNLSSADVDVQHALNTLDGNFFQPLATILTNIANLPHTAGYIYNNGDGSVSISTSIGSIYYTWSTVTDTSLSLVANNAYILNSASLITATLPISALKGDRYYIVGRGTGGWRVAQNIGQTIYIGDANTTTGTGGYLASVHSRDSVEILCVVADTEFQVIGNFGNIVVN